MKNLIRKLIQYNRIKYRCPKDGMEVEVEARGQPAQSALFAAPQCNMSGQSNDIQGLSGMVNVNRIRPITIANMWRPVASA